MIKMDPILYRKGAKQPPPPTRVADNLRSEDSVEVLLAIGEGPFQGPVKDGYKSYFLGTTAIENVDGSRNYEDMEIEFFPGTAIPDDVAFKLGGTSSSQTVNVNLFSGTSVTRTTTTGEIDFLDVRLRVDSLFNATDDGDQLETDLIFRIRYKPTSSGTWTTVGTNVGWNDGPGTDWVDIFTRWGLWGGLQQDFYDNEVRPNINGPFPNDWAGATNPGDYGSTLRIYGKTTSPYVREIRIPVDRLVGDTYDVEVTKLSPESDTNYTRELTWESLQEIDGETKNYPNLAMYKVFGRATDQFTSIPEFSAEMNLQKVQVPTILAEDLENDQGDYDFSAPWDYSMKEQWTNRLAWILYDMIHNPESGLAKFYPISFSKDDALEADLWWSAHDSDPLSGTYGDFVGVSDGNGGVQKRVSMNIVIQEPRDALEALNYLAGAGNGVFYDNQDGTFKLRVDKNDAATHIVTKEKIVNGKFKYSFTDINTRYNDYTVVFRNKNLPFYREDRRRVFSQTDIDDNGQIPHNFIAVGCTDPHEAVRRTTYKLLTGINETMQVQFDMAKEGMYIEPFEVILIADDDHEWGISGRAASYTGSTVTLRDAVTLESGVTYTMKIEHGSAVYEYTVTSPTSGSTTSLTLDSALPVDLPDHFAFTLESTDYGSLKPFRVLTVDKSEEGLYSVTALELYRAKFDLADGASPIGNISTGGIARAETAAPVRNVTTDIQTRSTPNGTRYDIDVNWERPAEGNVKDYRVAYMYEQGPLQNVPYQPQIGYRLEDVAPGRYRIVVYSRNYGLQESLPVTTNITVASTANVNPNVGTPRLNNRKDNSVNEYVGDTAIFEWGFSAVTPWEDYNRGAPHPEFSHWAVMFYDAGDVLRGTSSNITDWDARWFAIDETTLDGIAGIDKRSFKVAVRFYNEDATFTESAKLTLSKPALPVPGSGAVTAAARKIHLKHDTVTDPDYRGTAVYMSTSSGFTPGPSNLALVSPSQPVLDALPNTTYYIRYGAIDVFENTPTNISSELSINTGQLGTDDISDNAITISKVDQSVRDEINRVAQIGRSVVPGGINAGAQGDVVFVKNSNNGTEATDNGEIYITNQAASGADDTFFYHPNFGRIDLTHGTVIQTPFEGDTSSLPEKFYVMYSQSNTRTSLSINGAPENWYVASYDELTDVWTAYGNTNSSTFTPAVTDIILGVGEKDVPASGGITSLINLIGNVAPLEQRVYNTEQTVGSASDPASPSGSLFARLADEASIRQDGDTAAGYRLSTIEAGRIQASLTDVHPDLVWEWSAGTNDGVPDAVSQLTPNYTNNGMELTATSSTGHCYARWDLSGTESALIEDWHNVRYAVVTLEYVSGAADVPLTPEFSWRSGANNASTWIEAENSDINNNYVPGQLYTFVFDLYGSTDSGAVEWGDADPTAIFFAPADSSDQTINDKWRVYKIAFASYSDVSYAEQRARADILQTALLDGDGTSEASIILQTVALSGGTETVARGWLTTRANPSGQAVSEIGFLADTFAIWHPSIGGGSNTPVFEISGGKIALRSDVEVEGSLIVSESITTDKIDANTFTGREFSASMDLTIGSGSRIIRMSGRTEEPYAMWLGNADPSLAGFRLSPDGDIFANSLTLATDDGYSLLDPTNYASDLLRTQILLGSGYRVRTLQTQLPDDTTDYDVTLEAETGLAVEGRFKIGGSVKTGGASHPATVQMKLWYRFNGGAWTQIGATKTWTKTTDQATYDANPDDYYLVTLWEAPIMGQPDIEVIMPYAELRYSQTQLSLPEGDYEYKVEVTGASSFPSQQRGLALTDTSGSGFYVEDNGATVGSGGAPGGFLSLIDTPVSYGQQKRKVPRVSDDELRMEFAALSTLTGIVNVQDYGILPSNSAATNDANWTTLRNKIISGDFGVANKAAIYFPAGTYNTAAGFGLPHSVWVFGAGVNNTFIVTTGATAFTHTPTASLGFHAGLRMHDLTIYCTGRTAGSKAVNVAFPDDQSAAAGTIAYTNESRVYISRVNVFGSGLGNFFDFGFLLRNVSYYRIEDCRYIGSNGQATYGSPQYFAGTGIRIETQTVGDLVDRGQSLEGIIEHFTVSDCDTGIDIFGYPEGQYIAHSNAVRCRYGVKAVATTATTQPSLVLHHNHFNCVFRDVVIDGYSQSYVQGNSLSYWNTAGNSDRVITVSGTVGNYTVGETVTATGGYSAIVRSWTVVEGGDDVLYVGAETGAFTTGAAIVGSTSGTSRPSTSQRRLEDANFNATEWYALEIKHRTNSLTEEIVVEGNHFLAESTPSAKTGAIVLAYIDGQDILVGTNHWIGKQARKVDTAVQFGPNSSGCVLSKIQHFQPTGITTKIGEGGTDNTIHYFIDTVFARNDVAGGFTYWEVATDQAAGFWKGGVLERDWALQDPENAIRIAAYNTGSLVLLDKTAARVLINQAGNLDLAGPDGTWKFRVDANNLDVRLNSGTNFDTGAANIYNVGNISMDANPGSAAAPAIRGGNTGAFQYTGQYWFNSGASLGLTANGVAHLTAGAGQVLVPSGTSNSVPGLGAIAYPTSGIRWPAADQMFLTVNGQARLQFTSAAASFVNSAVYLGRFNSPSWIGGQLQMQGPGGTHIAYLTHATDGTVAIQHFNGSTTETMANFIRDGGVQLLHNNALKAETDINGLSVTGRVAIAGTSTQLYSDNLQLGADVFVSRIGTAQGALWSSSNQRVTWNASGGQLIGAWTVGSLISGGNIDLDGYDLIVDADGDSYLHSPSDDVVNLVIASSNAFSATAASVSVLNRPLFMGRQNGVGGEAQFQGPTGGDRTFYWRHGLDGQMILMSYDVSEATFENHIIANRNGSVDLYFDNAVRLATSSAGVTVSGHLTTGNILCGDASVSDAYLTGKGVVVSNDDGGGSGRIIIDAENVTSGYSTRIAQNDTGFFFESQSNSRPIYFRTGSTLADRMVIGTTTVDFKGLRLLGMGENVWHESAAGVGRQYWQSANYNIYATGSATGEHIFWSLDSSGGGGIGLRPDLFRITPYRGDSDTYFERHADNSLRWVTGGYQNLWADANRVYLGYQSATIAETSPDALRLKPIGLAGGKLRLQGYTGQAEWALAAGPSGGNYFTIQNLTGTIHLLADAASGESWLYGPGTAQGARLKTKAYGVEVVSQNNNPIRLGEWNSGYSGLLDYAGNYLIMSGEEGGYAGTLISARAGGGVLIRSGANDNTNEFLVGGGAQTHTVGGIQIGTWTSTSFGVGIIPNAAYRAHIQGQGTGTGTYGLVVQDSVGNAGLRVRDDGEVYFRNNIVGAGGGVIRSVDSWLRINDFGTVHASGVFFGTSRLRTDGSVFFDHAGVQTIGLGGGNSFQFANANGYVNIGPQNTGYCHFFTDRSLYYFNKSIEAETGFTVYNTATALTNGQLQLSTGETLRASGDTVIAQAGGVDIATFAATGVTIGATATTGGSLTLAGEGSDLAWAFTQDAAQFTIGSSTYSHLQMTEAGATNHYHAGVLVAATNGSGWNVLKGLKVGNPTGGWKGDGTINAVAVYDDNVLLTDYVFDRYLDGQISEEDRDNPRAVEFDARALDPNWYESFWSKERRLQNMPSREEFREGGISVGALTQRLWEAVEIQAVHDSIQRDEIEDLKKQVKELKRLIKRLMR